MNWNNFDTKYIIKRLIIGFGMLILFSIITTKKANADTYYPEGMEFWFTNNSVVGLSFTNTTRFGERYIYHNSSSTAEINGAFAVVNGHVSAKYFSFSMLKGQPVSTISGRVQFDDGTMSTCQMYEQISDNSNGTLYTATCDLDNIGNKAIYRYGFTWTDSFGYNVSYNSILLSQFNYYQKESEYNQALTNIYNNINNTTNAINNASNQAHQDAQQINNTLTNDNVDGANSDLDNFKNSSTFTDSTGLQAVLELPLNLVNSFTNTCQPISITIPWLDYTGTIPCMSTIYRQHFNELYSVVALIVNAFFIYRLLLKIYELVHNAKQPDEDKLEVIDL